MKGLNMVKEFIKYCRHFFDQYKIYKINDEGYAVKELFDGWIGRNVEDVWYFEKYLHYCLVDSCEEAYDIIKRRKEYLKSINPKIKFAKECYKN